MPKNQLRRIIDTKKSSDGLVLMTGTPPAIPGGGVVTDHGALSGLNDNDHPQYLLATTASSTYALRGLTVTLGNGITGTTATLASNFTISVGAGNGIAVSADAVSIQLDTDSGLSLDGANGLRLNPASITLSSNNTPSVGSHSHTIVTSSNATNAQILSSTSGGGLGLKSITVPLINTVGDDTSLLIAPTGDIVLNPTGKDVLPYAPYDINLGTLNKKYLALHAAELWVETLVAQDTIATIGGRILVGPTTALTVDLPTGGTTITVKHNQMTIGDGVYMEAGGKVEFMRIASSATNLGTAPGGLGPYTYTVNRNLDGTGANAWFAGDAMFNTGKVNSGFIDLYSIRGVNPASPQYGPTIVGNVRTANVVNTTSGPATMFNAWEPRWAVGNLNGLYDYGSNTYGFAAGKFSQSWIAVDATKGFRVMSGLTPRIEITTTGDLYIKNHLGAHVITLFNDGRSFFNNVMLLGNVGEIRQGQMFTDGAWDTDDGRIFPLTDNGMGGFTDDPALLAVKYSGLRIWQYNGYGHIAGYRDGVQQWNANVEGMITAGGGNVTLQRKGLVFKRAINVGYGTDEVLAVTENSVSWMSDPLNDAVAAANIVGGTHQSGTSTKPPFMRLSISNIDPEEAGSWIAMESRGEGEFFWFTGFNYVAGIPGATFNKNTVTGVSTARFGQDGSGDWFIISENTTTRVGGHWVPSTNYGKNLGVVGLYWANLYVGDIHSTGTAYFNNVVITGEMTGEAEESFASVFVEGDIVVAGTVDGVRVSDLDSNYSVHAGDSNIHHNRAHNLLSFLDHYISGQEAGHVLTVTSPSTFEFMPIDSVVMSALGVADTASVNMSYSGGVFSAVVIPSGISHNSLAGIGANDHHAQVHALDSTDHTGTLSWAKVNKTGSSLVEIASRNHSVLTGIGPDDHHDQAHAYDSADHTGFLSWAKINTAGSALTDIATRPHSSLTGIGTDDHHPQVHALVSANHTVTGLTTGHFLRANSPTTFGFSAITLADLPAAGAAFMMLRSDNAGKSDWESIGTLAGAGISHTDGVLSIGASDMITVNDNNIELTQAPGPYQFIWSPAGGAVEWQEIDYLAGAGLMSADGSLYVNINATLTSADDTVGVNLENNFVWTGTHQFNDTVQINSTLTTQHLIPALTDTYDIGSVTTMYRASWISTMNAVVFAENTAQLIGGWFIIPKYAGKLGPVTSGQTVIDFGPGITFALNDVVLVRAHTAAGGGAVAAEYMTIGTNAGGNTWNVTRDVSDGNTPDPDWPDGTPYLLLGKTNDARIELDAQNTPRISLIRQATDAYNSGAEVIRIGDLVNTFSYGATTTWGMSFGKYGVAANTWLTLDLVNGVRIGNNTDIIGQWDLTGKVIIGRVANLRARVEIDDTNGLQILFRDSGAVDVPKITLSVAGNAYISGRFNIATTGDLYQGTGTPGPTTGVLTSAGVPQTWGTAYTGTRIGNIGGVGILAGYNSSTLQWWGSTDGKFYGGTGNIILDATGLAIKSAVGGAWTNVNGVRFLDTGGNGRGGLFSKVNGTISTTKLYGNIDAQTGVVPASTIGIVEITAEGGVSSQAEVDMEASNASGLSARVSCYVQGTTQNEVQLMAEVIRTGGVLRPQIIGSVSAPVYSFNTFTNYGMYADTNELNFSVASTERLSLTTTGAIVTGTLSATFGSEALPAYTFSGDGDTGMWRPNANEIALSTGGTNSLLATNLGVTLVGFVKTTTGNIRNIVNVAAGAKYALDTLQCFVVITSIAGSTSAGGVFWCSGATVTRMIGAGSITTDGSGTSYSVYHDGTQYVFQNLTAGTVSVGIWFFSRR